MSDAAAARDGERLDAVDNVGDFSHNCRCIRPHALIVPHGLFFVMGRCPLNSPCSYHVRLDHVQVVGDHPYFDVFAMHAAIMMLKAYRNGL